MLFAAPSAAAVDRINKHVVELEAQKGELEAELSGLKIAAAITYTRDEVVAWLKQFCNGDPLEAEFRRRIVETFINSVYVYDDRIVIYFNVRGGKQISYARRARKTKKAAAPITEPPQAIAKRDFYTEKIPNKRPRARFVFVLVWFTKKHYFI